MPQEKSRRPKNFVQFVKCKPRGLVDGPKRTPPTIGDVWQNQVSYVVEEVSPLRKEICQDIAHVRIVYRVCVVAHSTCLCTTVYTKYCVILP